MTVSSLVATKLTIIHGLILVVGSIWNRFIIDFMARKRDLRAKIFENLVSAQCRIGLYTGLTRFMFILRLILGHWSNSVVRHPVTFLVFYSAECFFGNVIVAIGDIITIVRYVNIFHENLFKLRDDRWWVIRLTASITLLSIGNSLSILLDIIQDYVLGHTTNDLMAGYWMGLPINSELFLSSANITYHIVAAVGTILVHIWIRRFIHRRFVSIAGLDPCSARFRHEQNMTNFNQCLLIQMLRIVLILPASFLLWAPSKFLGSSTGSTVFLCFYTLYSLYISCCPGSNSSTMPLSMNKLEADSTKRVLL